MSCADGVTYQPGMATYRVTVVETHRREITLNAWNPADAVNQVIEHGGAEGSAVLHNRRCGPVTVTVESVARLSVDGPPTTRPPPRIEARIRAARVCENPSARGSGLIGFRQYREGGGDVVRREA
jgi:hypothetical protein